MSDEPVDPAPRPGRPVSRALLGFIFACFLLPFAQVGCSSEVSWKGEPPVASRAARPTGLQLVTGTEAVIVERDEPKVLTVRSQPLAIVVLLLAAGGIGASFLGSPHRFGYPAGFSLLGVMALVALASTLRKGLTVDGGRFSGQVVMESGWLAAFSIFLLCVFIDGIRFLLRLRRRTAKPSKTLREPWKLPQP